MDSDNETKPVNEGLQRNQNPILTYVAPIFVIFGVVAAAIFYYLSVQQKNLEIRERIRVNEARANIIYYSDIVDCEINVENGTRRGCALNVIPTDANKKLMNFLVQFPTGYYAGGARYRGTINGAKIDVAEGMEYLVARAQPFINNINNYHEFNIPIPVIIYSTYEYEGQEYNDRSLYYLFYVVVPQPEGHVIPVSLLRCGRLDREAPQIDFLIDPWVRPLLGYSRNASFSLMFGCSGYAWLNYVNRGQYRAESDLSPGQRGAPRGNRRSFQLDPSSLRFQSATSNELTISAEIIEIGGPALRNFRMR